MENNLLTSDDARAQVNVFNDYAIGAYNICKQESAPFSSLYNFIDRYTAVHFRYRISAKAWDSSMSYLEDLYNDDVCGKEAEVCIREYIGDMLHEYIAEPNYVNNQARDDIRIVSCNPATRGKISHLVEA